jgi:hypothetical protein
MSGLKWARTVIVVWACFSLVLPLPLLQAQQPPSRATPLAPTPCDVGLYQGGFLHGTVVDGAGRRKAGAVVRLFQDDTLVGATETNTGGEFSIQLARGGIYQLVAGDRVMLVRCWAPATSPPSAHQSLLISLEETYRGQVSPATCSLANPWVIAGIAVAAIAIPVALAANRDDRPAASQ